MSSKASRGTLIADEFDASYWAKVSGQPTAARLFAEAAGPVESIALVRTWLVLVGLGPDGQICELTAELAEE